MRARVRAQDRGPGAQLPTSFPEAIRRPGMSEDDALAAMAAHPRLRQWQQRLTHLLARYMFGVRHGDTQPAPLVSCPGGPGPGSAQCTLGGVHRQPPRIAEATEGAVVLRQMT